MPVCVSIFVSLVSVNFVAKYTYLFDLADSLCFSRITMAFGA